MSNPIHDQAAIERLIDKTSEGDWHAGTTTSDEGGIVGMVYVKDTMGGKPAHRMIATNMTTEDAVFVANYGSPAHLGQLLDKIKEQHEQQRQTLLQAIKPIMPLLDDMLQFAGELIDGKQYDMEHTPQDWGTELEGAQEFWADRRLDLMNLRAYLTPEGTPRA